MSEKPNADNVNKYIQRARDNQSHDDFESAMNNLRKALEIVIISIYDANKLEYDNEHTNNIEAIDYLYENNYISKYVKDMMHRVRIAGNRGSHWSKNQNEITESEVKMAINDMTSLLSETENIIDKPIEEPKKTEYTYHYNTKQSDVYPVQDVFSEDINEENTQFNQTLPWEFRESTIKPREKDKAAVRKDRISAVIEMIITVLLILGIIFTFKSSLGVAAKYELAMILTIVFFVYIHKIKNS